VYAILRDPKFYSLLLRLDHDHAEQVRGQGCACCGGPLHVADYDRKPRGGAPWLDEEFCQRLSFCCAACRRRTTPASVRFLGRRVYLAAAVVLVSALRMGLSARRVSRLHALLGVSGHTLRRWRQWWAEAFVQGAFWSQARGVFLPPLEAGSLPAGLLERFQGAERRERLLQCLIFLRPLRGAGPGTLAAGR
jgi:hypothetical protein